MSTDEDRVVVPLQRGTKGHRAGHYELVDVTRGRGSVPLVEVRWHPGDGSPSIKITSMVPERVPLLDQAVTEYLRPEPEAEDEPEADPGPCRACGGPLVPLGTLGRRVWFRCRDCGLDHGAIQGGGE